MSSLVIADFLLRLLGNNPEAYAPADKWITILADVFVYSLPITLLFLLFLPFIWIWRKKKGWTLRNIILAIVSSIILMAFGLLLFVLLISYLGGQAFLRLYG